MEDIFMMKLVLIRHGESEWNKLNLFTGWTDVDLSEKGHEEAKEAGRLLKEAGYDFDICYTSYLKRAIHTLNHVLDEMDRAWLPVVKTWRLNERHYGALQGLNKSETAEKGIYSLYASHGIYHAADVGFCADPGISLYRQLLLHGPGDLLYLPDGPGKP